jgi:hypothetical protein
VKERQGLVHFKIILGLRCRSVVRGLA